MRVVINSFIRPVTETERNSIKLKKKTVTRITLQAINCSELYAGHLQMGTTKPTISPSLPVADPDLELKGGGRALLYRLPCWLFFLMQFFFFFTQNKRGRSATAYAPPPPFTLCPFYSSTLFLFLCFTECGSFN